MKKILSNPRRSVVSIVLVASLLTMILFSSFVSAEITKPMAVSVNGGFEETLGAEWEAKWCAIAATTDDKHAGDKSLAVTARDYFFSSPAQTVSLTGGVTYTISMYVKMLTGQANTKIIFCINDAAGNNLTAWDYIATATDADWVQITGTYTPAADLEGFVSFLTYDEANGAATTSFYLDDYSLTYPVVVPVPDGDNIVRNPGAEEALAVTEDPFDPALTWTPRNFGWATVSIDTTVKKTGDSSLLTSERMGFWASATQAFDLVGGEEYYVSGWVYVPDLTYDTARIILCFNDELGNNLSGWDITAVVTEGEWVAIEGLFTPSMDYTGSFISFLTYDIDTTGTHQAAGFDFNLDDLLITYEGYELPEESSSEESSAEESSEAVSEEESSEEVSSEDSPQTGEKSASAAIVLFTVSIMAASVLVFRKRSTAK